MILLNKCSQGIKQQSLTISLLYTGDVEVFVQTCEQLPVVETKLILPCDFYAPATKSRGAY